MLSQEERFTPADRVAFNISGGQAHLPNWAFPQRTGSGCRIQPSTAQSRLRL